MKQNLTELIFILDKSGSMGGLEKDTIGGFNSLIEKQKSVAGDANITTVLFDNSYSVIHKRVPIKQLQPLTENEYFVGGSTALLDAMGITIEDISDEIADLVEDEKPEKVVVVTVTDGEENSSRAFNLSQIRKIVKEKTKKDKWEFLFLGANINAIHCASNLGIGAKMASNYSASTEGVKSNYASISKALQSYRENGIIDKKWKNGLK
ncbi:MAG: hypothetical protein AB7S44_03430 [Spirochaetales bacterium]